MSKHRRGTTADSNRRRERHARKKRELLSGGMVRVRSRLEDFTTHPESMTAPERWLFDLANLVDGK